MKFLITACLALLTLSLSSLNTSAATPAPSSDGAEEVDAARTSSDKMHAVPFRGTIATFDDRTRTFTLAGKGAVRALKIAETTVITKGGNPATMKDIVANDEVRGSYYKMSDGTLEAKTLKLGPLTEAEKAEKQARKDKRASRKSEASASATP